MDLNYVFTYTERKKFLCITNNITLITKRSRLHALQCYKRRNAIIIIKHCCSDAFRLTLTSVHHLLLRLFRISLITLEVQRVNFNPRLKLKRPISL